VASQDEDVTRKLIMTAEPDRDGVPPADDAVAWRYGYCGQCGRVFPESRPGGFRGTLAQVRQRLAGAFRSHRCNGSE
jgi:hypothetical protein